MWCAVASGGAMLGLTASGRGHAMASSRGGLRRIGFRHRCWGCWGVRQKHGETTDERWSIIAMEKMVVGWKMSNIV
jgi:hypothetical protein